MLSSLVPSPIEVTPKAARSTQEFAPISTRSPISTRPICGNFSYAPPVKIRPNPSAPITQPGMQNHRIADAYVGINRHMRMDDAVRADADAIADGNQRSDAGAGVDLRSLADDGGGMDAGLRGGLRLQERDEGGRLRRAWIGERELRFAFQGWDSLREPASRPAWESPAVLRGAAGVTNDKSSGPASSRDATRRISPSPSPSQAARIDAASSFTRISLRAS